MEGEEGRRRARHAGVKWVKSNGVILQVRDCGPVLYSLRAPDKKTVLPIHDEVMSDDDARALLTKLRDTGRYSKGDT